MLRDKSKDNAFFDCSREEELNYISGLYINKKKVYAYLKHSCDINLLKKITHKHLFILIKSIMGYEIPD